jgi:hypothetical protein
MKTEISALGVRGHIGTMLVAYRMTQPRGDEFALDLIEYIARRMRDREDYHVAELGIFVRVNLINLKAGKLSFTDTHLRLTSAALHAPYGHDALRERFVLGALPPAR